MWCVSVDKPARGEAGGTSRGGASAVPSDRCGPTPRPLQGFGARALVLMVLMVLVLVLVVLVATETVRALVLMLVLMVLMTPQTPQQG